MKPLIIQMSTVSPRIAVASSNVTIGMVNWKTPTFEASASVNALTHKKKAAAPGNTPM